MSHDRPQDPNAQARTHVNLKDAADVQYWTERFGVSEEALRDAVDRVGSTAEAVARQLEKNWLP